MKAMFEIEWKDDLGKNWMNEYNLLICLNTKEHCGEGLVLDVKACKKPENSVSDKSI